MQPITALRALPARGPVRRRARKHCFFVSSPLAQADDFAGHEVDGREENHGMETRDEIRVRARVPIDAMKLRSRVRPARWLFSGWELGREQWPRTGYRRRKSSTVVTRRRDDRRVRRLRHVGVHKVEIRLIGQTLPGTAVARDDSIVFQTDVRHLDGIAAQPAHGAGEMARQARHARRLLARFEKQLVTETDAEEGPAVAQPFRNGFPEFTRAQLRHAIAERPNSRQDERIFVLEAGWRTVDAHLAGNRGNRLRHAA